MNFGHSGRNYVENLTSIWMEYDAIFEMKNRIWCGQTV